MNILLLTFYFEPDLCAGSFRNSPLFKELLSQTKEGDFIHVITTQPNRYKSYNTVVEKVENGINFKIDRIKIPDHNSGLFDQATSFLVFYKEAFKLARKNKYDLVYASSSRLFTAFLGRRISYKQKLPLYLDIRDIFVDTMKDVFKHRKIIQIPAVAFLKIIEKYTFSRANHINLVSEGFKDYFLGYPKPAYTFFTNGIDDIFLEDHQTYNSRKSDVKIITYTGNIGSGQGLEKIIPQAAKILGNKYLFKIIGDGGTKVLLKNKVEELCLTNVELINPVSRDELIAYYKEADFLFLHLNDLAAFKNVLPSKIFEYATFNKPIIAGVSGYANKFIKDNLDNYILFNPTDVNGFVSQLKLFRPGNMDRTKFIEKFARKNIMKNMAGSILNVRN
ncbi:MAG: glycosyltransferase family 4 protein [Prolixibacteraceae bacterium]|nr:glycosyltransferase family 4 protein [Prolixibacteraceae bacterium]